MYRLVVLLLFGLTIVYSLPEYFTAFKYEKFLIGNETKCFVNHYEFKTKVVENDTGEDFSNYLPVAAYDSPCYSGYKHNEMSFMRDKNDDFYLVHCLFFPDDNQRMICDMFEEDGSHRIVDVQCNNPKLTGVNNPSFYIADYLTRQNPNEFLYGDSIMYTENIEIHDSDGSSESTGKQLVCGKQIGYVPFDTVIDGFILDGFNYWDPYLAEGYNFKTPGKRLLFRGKNHLINTEDGWLNHGNLNDGLRRYISKADYDMFINLDLTDYSFIFPKLKHDGLIMGNTSEGFINTSTNESQIMEEYLDLFNDFIAVYSFDESTGSYNYSYEYCWDRENREFFIVRLKKDFTKQNDKYGTLVLVFMPGNTARNVIVEKKLKTFFNPSFKFHEERKHDFYALNINLKDTYFTTDYSAVDAYFYRCISYDPLYNQYLEFDQSNYTVNLFEGKHMERADYEKNKHIYQNFENACVDARASFFFGRYPIMRTNLGLDKDDYKWLSVYGDGKYDDVLKEYKPRYAFEEIMFYKFISQQIRPTPKE